MKGQAIIAALLTFSLAGCFGAADPPTDAVTDSDEALPGLTLSAWTEMRGGRIRMMALVTNDGPDPYDIRIGCGEPWRSTIIGPQGESVDYREVLEEPACPTYWDVLRPRADVEALYSWNFRDHDVEASTSTPVAPGVYEWVLQFTLRGRPEILETRIPIRVEGSGAGPLSDFSMDLRTGTIPGQYGVNVTVHNGGTTDPEFWTGCGMEWAMQILDEGGDVVPLRAEPRCQGFTTTTFPAGDNVYAEFFWNGTAWDGERHQQVPAGVYQWEITFGLQGTQGDVLVRKAAFTV